MPVHTPETVTSAIVVLAYQLTDKGEIALPLVKRLDLAVKLYRQGVAKTIIACGWRALKREDLGVYCEAKLMRDYIHEKYGRDIPVLIEPYSTSIPENLLFTRALFPRLRQLTVVTAKHALARARFLGSMVFTGNAEVTYVGCDDGTSGPEREVKMLGDVECIFESLRDREGFRQGKWKALLLPSKKGRLQSRWNNLRLEHHNCPYWGKVHPKP